MTKVKAVIVGDWGVGKTCLFISYANNSFPQDYVPTVFDNYNSTVVFENHHITISLWDTVSNIDDKLRSLAYPETNVFLIAFSLVDPESLKHVKTIWYPEIMKYWKGVPIVLVGTKLDLRGDSQVKKKLQDQNEKSISREQGEKIAEEIKAYGYFECSAKSMKGVQEVFHQGVISSTLKYRPSRSDHPKSECCVML